MKKYIAVSLAVVSLILFSGCPDSPQSILYDITYAANDADSGTVPVDPGSYEASDEATVLGNSGGLSRPGYLFIGWNTLANGSGVAYEAGDTLSIDGNRVLYALWEENIMQAAVGPEYTLIIDQEGELWAMGMNGRGQLANGETTRVDDPELVWSGVKAVSASDQVSATMILEEDGDLYAVGYNENGQLGTGDTVSKTTAVRVMQNVAAVSCGGFHTMVLDADGVLYGSGSNVKGQLGLPSTTASVSTFTQIAEDIVFVSAGFEHTAIIDDQGDLFIFGINGSGQLGISGTGKHYYPLDSVASNVLYVSAGEAHTMYVNQDHELYATGSTNYGELGNGSDEYASGNVFSFFKTLEGVRKVFAGDNSTLVIKTDGSLWTVGSDSDYKLGYSETTHGHHTEWHNPKNDIHTAVLGGNHSILIDEEGLVWGAGSNVNRQLGQDTTGDEQGTYITIDLEEVQ